MGSGVTDKSAYKQMPSYNDPKHPEHKEWLIARRERFCKIVREGKRVCKLDPVEKELVMKAVELIEKNTKRMK